MLVSTNMLPEILVYADVYQLVTMVDALNSAEGLKELNGCN